MEEGAFSLRVRNLSRGNVNEPMDPSCLQMSRLMTVLLSDIPRRAPFDL
jgi:hypothetical protein